MADHGDDPVQRGGVGVAAVPCQTTRHQRLHVGVVDVGPDRSRPLGAGQEVAQPARHVVPGARGGGLQVVAGAGEGLGQSSVRCARMDQGGEEGKERGAGVFGIGQGVRLARELSPLIRVMMSPRLRMLTWWLLQSPQMGALSILRAAVDPDARGGDYYGPPGRTQFTGYPTRVQSTARSHDTQAQRRLWRESEQMTGVAYPIGAPVHPQTTPS